MARSPRPRQCQLLIFLHAFGVDRSVQDGIPALVKAILRLPSLRRICRRTEDLQDPWSAQLLQSRKDARRRNDLDRYSKLRKARTQSFRKAADSSISRPPVIKILDGYSSLSSLSC